MLTVYPPIYISSFLSELNIQWSHFLSQKWQSNEYISKIDSRYIDKQYENNLDQQKYKKINKINN